MTPEEVDRLADRLFAAIEAGDVEAVAVLYADDIEVWHNTSGHVQSKDENLALLSGLTSRAEVWCYEQVRRRCYPGGCCQQHVLRGGSWDDYGRRSRSASRHGHRPGDRDETVGFRVVVEDFRRK